MITIVVSILLNDVNCTLARNRPVSAHMLRHSCMTNLVRVGNDRMMVAEIAGHQRLETTRRYSLPSEADRQEAMENIRVEY